MYDIKCEDAISNQCTETSLNVGFVLDPRSAQSSSTLKSDMFNTKPNKNKDKTVWANK